MKTTYTIQKIHGPIQLLVLITLIGIPEKLEPAEGLNNSRNDWTASPKTTDPSC